MPQIPIIESLKDKVNKVIADNRRLREQNVKLRQSGEKLKREKIGLQERIAELERRVNVLELSASMGGNAQHKKLARARVNRLMREVDHCISLINKQ